MKRISLFFVLGIIALQIPFTHLMGADVKFTAFDFFAPVYGAFLGTIPGIITALTAQLISALFHGGFTDIGQVLRLFPSLFGIWYFSSSRRSSAWIAAAAIIAFNLHPIGRSAWQFSLFWLIPIAASFYKQNIIARAAGATFTAHAVGGAMWVWFYGLSQTIWLALIPQVIIERLMMTAGIAITYLVTSYTIQAYQQKTLIPSFRLSLPL